MKKYGSKNGSARAKQKITMKMFTMPRWAYLRADAHDLLRRTVRSRGGVEFDVLLDVNDGPVGAGHDGLDGGTGKPIDHRAAHEQTEEHLGWTSESFATTPPKVRSSMRMMPNTMVVAPTTAVPMSTGLAVALKVLPAPSPFSSRYFAWTKSGAKPKSRSISAAMPGCASICESSKTDWAVVGHRAEAVDGDRHRAHAEEAERHQAESKDGRGKAELRRHDPDHARVLGEQIGQRHQSEDGQSPSRTRRSCRLRVRSGW